MKKTTITPPEFHLVELESRPDYTDTVEFSYKLKIEQKIPKFERQSYCTAWLKYLLDSHKVCSISRICGKCRRTLLDSEDVCTNCGSKNMGMHNRSYDVMITNGSQIQNIKITSDLPEQLWYIGRRLTKAFPSEFINLLLIEDALIVSYPCIEDFPDISTEEAQNKLFWVFMSASDKKLYILDYRELYNGTHYVREIAALMKVQSFDSRIGIEYIEVTSDNIDIVLDRVKRNRDKESDAWERR